MASAPSQIRESRQNVTVEISFKPLPPASRFRALIISMVADVRNRMRRAA